MLMFDRRQAGFVNLSWVIVALGAGCAHVDHADNFDPAFVTSSSPLRIVSANDGDALRSLGRPGSDLPDSISVIDLSADAPPETRTVSGTVPNTFTGPPHLAIVSGGRYALIPNHAWGSDDQNRQSPNQVAVVDLDSPDLAVVATLPLPEHAWQVQALPDGDRAIAISNHQFHLIELESGRPRIVSQSEPFSLHMFSFAISPDGRSIIVTAAEELSLSTAVELHHFAVNRRVIDSNPRPDGRRTSIGFQGDGPLHPAPAQRTRSG
jgi:hypothetical protein